MDASKLLCDMQTLTHTFLFLIFRNQKQDSDNCWWDSFANEFFEDEAQLTLTFCLEDGPKRYSKLI